MKWVQCVVSSQEMMLVMLLLLCYTIIVVLVLNNMKTRRWNMLKRRPEAWQRLTHSSGGSQTLFCSLAFTLQVHKCLLVCTASITSENLPYTVCFKDAEILMSYFALPSSQLLNCICSFSSQKLFLSCSWAPWFGFEVSPALNRGMDQKTSRSSYNLSDLVILIPLLLQVHILDDCTAEILQLPLWLCQGSVCVCAQC